MPDLPTLTVTTTAAQRLLAAFSGQIDENGNALTPQQAYKRWLRDNLVGFVIATERTTARADLEGQVPLA